MHFDANMPNTSFCVNFSFLIENTSRTIFQWFVRMMSKICESLKTIELRVVT